jgi:hypothetical protein
MGWTKSTGTCTSCSLRKTVFVKTSTCPACYRKKLIAEGKFDPKRSNDERKKRLKERGCLKCGSSANRMATAKLCSVCYYASRGKKRKHRERANSNYRAMYARRSTEIAARERVKYWRNKGIEALRVEEVRRRDVLRAESIAKQAAEEKSYRDRAERERIVREHQEALDRATDAAILREAKSVASDDRDEASRRTRHVQEGTCLVRSCTNPACDEGDPPASALCQHHVFRWNQSCAGQNPYRSPAFRPSVAERDKKSIAMDFRLLENLLRDAWKDDRPGLPQF